MNSDDDMIEEEDSYEESEATMIFAAEMKKQFKKEFPLKAETEKRRKEEAFRRHAPKEARKLNFDITLSPEPSELIKAKSDKENAQRQLNSLREEHERLKEMLKAKEAKLAEKSIDSEANRERILDLQERCELLKQEKDETAQEYNQSLEIWTQFGKKYYTWFNLASSQLDAVKTYVKSDGKFDSEEEIHRLNSMPRNMLRTLENFDFEEETVEMLGAGSVQEYDGVEFEVRRRAESPEAVVEAVRRADVSAANFTIPHSNQTMLDDTANNTLMQEDQTMMTDGCPANRSLIDYEKDDKIQRLLLENSVLKDRLNVSMGRAEKSMLMEEKNRTLEFEKKTLQSQLDNSFGEIEALRIGRARDIFKIDEKVSTESDNSAKQMQLLDRITELIKKNNQLEKDFEAATSRMTKIMRESTDCERRNERLEDAFSNERVKNQELERERDELADRIAEQNEEVERLKEQLEDVMNRTVKVAEEPTFSSTTLGAPGDKETDAGDNTKIFHMAMNPFQAARAEYQESKKRKLTDAPDGAAQLREEQMAELEDRLELVTREKKVLEDSYNLHKDLASKFRQACIALTGLQIKLKDADEGICTVQSEYEGGSDNHFVFKYFYGTPRIDMLDVKSDASEEMIQKWEPLMKK
ncbi:CRE-MDF-1 protein [Caenorhabditis remanei]|uniref:CRE-MDF-1 protein n=1 Tax=Caenorhabditis remanei TaxID=31234 RepID=E3NKM0_CAERE|nr:CRE-MDF-1 protein [Caenorhabditis remanei]